MTDQGKPSVCPTCGSDDPNVRECINGDYHSCGRYGVCQPCENIYHSSPVPAATTIAGFPLKVDPNMPPDQVELRGTKGRVVVTNVSAPQAESAPAGKDAAREFFIRELKREPRGPMDEGYIRFATEFFASETAALRAERDKWQDAWVRTSQSRDLSVAQVGRLERENKELRETHCPGCECGAE